MIKTTLSKILRLLLFQKNMNVSQLAKKTKLPQQTLQRLVSGTSHRPQEKTIHALANFFGLTHQQIKGEVDLPPAINQQFAENIHPEIKRIPLLAENEIEIFLNNPKKIRCEKFVLVNARLSGENHFALIMHDTSMEPFIPVGATLIFSRTRSYKDRALVLVKLHKHNHFVFRQILMDGKRCYLKPMRPDLATLSIHPMEKQDKVVGVLVEYRHSYEGLL